MTRSALFRHKILPRLPALMAAYPTETTLALVAMVEGLKQICEEDSTFLALLRGTAFLPCVPDTPTGAGAAPASAAPVVGLHRPCELFDPQVRRSLPPLSVPI